MKKLTTLCAVLLLFVFSCQKADQPANPEEEISAITERTCASQEILEKQLAADPGRRQRMQELEEFTARYIQNMPLEANRTAAITIPVVVHVVYNKAAERITADQVRSQIRVLNEDFNMTNPDSDKVTGAFATVKGGLAINFVLDRIIEKKTRKASFNTNDDVKFDATGGSTAIDPTNKLNLWSCNLGRKLLGYAQFPGGPAATDGVVIHYLAMGSDLYYPAGTYYSSYNLGRTATHEVGHWLNLYHIWGDRTCGDDEVGDTPVHNTANTGCPAANHTSTCNGQLEMWMNYMDYTYDACMYMFTKGQCSRMSAVANNRQL